MPLFFLWNSYFRSKVPFDQKADAEQQRKDIERGDYFREVFVNLARKAGHEVDKQEVSEEGHNVELDSVGRVSGKKVLESGDDLESNLPGNVTCGSHWTKKDF